MKKATAKKNSEAHFECGDIEKVRKFVLSAIPNAGESNAKVERYCGLKVIEKEGIPKDTIYLVSAEGKYVQSFKI